MHERLTGDAGPTTNTCTPLFLQFAPKTLTKKTGKSTTPKPTKKYKYKIIKVLDNDHEDYKEPVTLSEPKTTQATHPAPLTTSTNSYTASITNQDQADEKGTTNPVYIDVADLDYTVYEGILETPLLPQTRLDRVPLPLQNSPKNQIRFNTDKLLIPPNPPLSNGVFASDQDEARELIVLSETSLSHAQHSTPDPKISISQAQHKPVARNVNNEANEALFEDGPPSEDALTALNGHDKANDPLFAPDRPQEEEENYPSTTTKKPVTKPPATYRSRYKISEAKTTEAPTTTQPEPTVSQNEEEEEKEGKESSESEPNYQTFGFPSQDFPSPQNFKIPDSFREFLSKPPSWINMKNW